jgi:AAA family ATP:ADP antiporter
LPLTDEVRDGTAGAIDAPAVVVGAPARLLARVVDIRPDEVRVTLLSCAYFFFLLASYLILRPIRDEISVTEGVRRLPWLFTGTLAATLVVNPIFSALVARLPTRRFITVSYRFFVLNLVLFFVVLRVGGAENERWLAPAFFVWTSVFNLFVVSVFWGFMADVFTAEQGKRLFGFIGFGGTLGGITGSALTATLARRVGTVNLFLVSAALLEVAVWIVGRFPRGRPLGATERRSPAATHPSDAVIGGSAWSGIARVARSPYLLGICAYLLLFTVGSTFLYFQQAAIIGRTFVDRAERTSFLATMDLVVQTLTIVTQVLVTGRLLGRWGVGVTLALVPALSVLGFLSLGVAPSLAAFAIFHVLRRAGEYAVSKPAREVLFTVVPREDKYKAKSFIDTFVYRAGDQIAAWSNALLGALGVGAATIALVAVPVSAAWLGVGAWLGRRQRALVDAG